MSDPQRRVAPTMQQIHARMSPGVGYTATSLTTLVSAGHEAIGRLLKRGAEEGLFETGRNDLRQTVYYRAGTINCGGEYPSGYAGRIQVFENSPGSGSINVYADYFARHRMLAEMVRRGR